MDDLPRRGDDELDAAQSAYFAAMANELGHALDLTDVDFGALRVALSAAIDASGLATALATAKGEVDEWHERWLRLSVLDGYTYQSRLAAAEAALSTAKGERDAAVAALRTLAGWTDAKGAKFARDALATLEAPRAP